MPRDQPFARHSGNENMGHGRQKNLLAYLRFKSWATFEKAHLKYYRSPLLIFLILLYATYSLTTTHVYRRFIAYATNFNDMLLHGDDFARLSETFWSIGDRVCPIDFYRAS